MTPSAPRPAAAEPSPEGLRVARLGSFRLECGADLDRLEIGYRTWGEPSSRAVLVCHALTGSADADEWWGELFGPGRALDPSRDFIVCSNVLGGCYGSSGPTSRAEHLGRPFGPDFPEVTVRDMVRAQAKLLESLGVTTLDLVLGGSMGGMQALEWACMYPDRVRALGAVATSAAHSAWCIGTSEAQRVAIRTDPAWRQGYYGQGAGPRTGLGIARMIAMQSYRSWDSFDERFGRERQGEDDRFAVASYLDYQGEKLAERFDANTYLMLTEAMDTHDVGRDRGGIEAALRAISCPTLVVGIASDGLYPVQEQEQLAEAIPNARLELLHGPHGHDGFLIEANRLDRLVRRFRETSATRPHLRPAPAIDDRTRSVPISCRCA